mmetsp:Transcript_9058/g.26399  ORF Transcript_9058/g.26399 Transcript_9058/m.26399 type:complete len:259 (-) Transcript_9058:1133-1909(-)
MPPASVCIASGSGRVDEASSLAMSGGRSRKRSISDCRSYGCTEAVELCMRMVGEATRGSLSRHAHVQVKERVADAMAQYVEELVHKHSDVAEEDCKEEYHTGSLFWAKSIPAINVRDYAFRIAKYAGCSAGALVVACVIMRKFLAAMDKSTDGNFTVNPYTVHRVMLACCVLATKLQDDVLEDLQGNSAANPGPPSTNAEWGLVGGVSVHEVNRLELAVLNVLEFRTFVRPRQFMETIEMLSSRGFLDITDADEAIES